MGEDKYIQLGKWHEFNIGDVNREYDNGIYSIILNSSGEMRKLDRTSGLSMAIDKYNYHKLSAHLDISKEIIKKQGLKGFYVHLGDLQSDSKEIRWYYLNKPKKAEKRKGTITPVKVYLDTIPEFGNF